MTETHPAAVVLSARELVAGYGTFTALSGVSLELRAGELLAIVGPNGAGKSTLLRLLAGTMQPWRGAVELRGRAIASYERRELARNIATVAQENSVAFGFTVLEVVLMGRAPHLGPFHLESARDLEIACEALDRFDLLGFAERRIQELSGGERKRVFLARALAQEPAIALLDEPTAFLDLRHIAEIFDRMRELCARRQMAVAATLHDLNVAAQWSDRVILLKHGHLAAAGRPEEVLTADNLRAVYETDLYVGRNPATGAVAVLPAPSR